MATIEKRETAEGKISYRVKIRLKGTPQQTASFARKTDARLWVQQTEAAIREGRFFKTVEAKRHTLADLVDRFNENELPKIPRSGQIIGPQLIWWKNQIGYLPLAEVTPAVISEQRDKLHREGTARKKDIGPSTVNRYLTAISIAFSAAVKEWGWVDDTPMRKVRKLPEPKGRVRFLDDEERIRLLEACKASKNSHLYPIVILSLSTGGRKTEITSIAWKDVDLGRGTITLHDTKNGERRSLSLASHALEVVRGLAKVRHIHTDLLFPSERTPAKPIHIRHAWNEALQTAGIEDFHFHDLRHSCASYLAMNGASLAEIAEVLGHKTLQMVKRYAHLSEAHTAGVVERMNNKIFRGV